ncbi:hypothetical protein ABOM_005481 [Aspergillus bombycis]|uniref:Rhodopsin domain-containing protein n=1 Tax=Aspergillus bombycis TaxID=109264 RepID=A0A1F8A380_9EURO|nr:hypothetical protein ABOM_005481 [Aspergillus bombycis]OGM45778.1 hypothetical protein ABOM_005481 [Aspergillus bombycis]
MSPPPRAATPSLISTTLLVVAILFPILATLAVAVRIWSNISKAKRLFADDCVIIVALLCAWGVPIDVYVAAGLGGVGESTLPPLDAARVFLRALWIEIFPLIASLVLVKVSILLYYRRIFVTRWFQIAVWVYIAILLAWGIACLVAQALAGNPVTAAFNPLADNPLRYNYSHFSIVVTAMSMCFDVIVLCFPIPVIHRLMMSTRQKVQLAGIFWLGIFCCIASIIRFYYVYTEVYESTSSTGTNRYAAVTPGITWGTIEPSTSVIAACLPTYGHLFSASRNISSWARSLWSHVAKRNTVSGDHSSGSGRKSTTILTSIDSSYGSDQSHRGHHWQRLTLDQRDRDLEMGDLASKDHIPLASDVQPVSIQVSQSFTRQEQPASLRDTTTMGKPMGYGEVF